MEWVNELEATCSSLGKLDGSKYFKGQDCLECIKDLIRFLRRDDENHEIRRRLGEMHVVQYDLIPLLKEESFTDPEIFDLVLRILVNLTNPELLLYREEMPENKFAMNHFIQLQRQRQKYQEAFADKEVWIVLTKKLEELLKKDHTERSEEDEITIERILILIRNILQVPRDTKTDDRIDNDISVHDEVLWVLYKSKMQDLLLYISSSEAEAQYCLHVLEIISLMFKEQDPTQLASANFQRSKEEKDKDTAILSEARAREAAKKQEKIVNRSTRHSRFGGTFVIQNMKSIKDGNFVINHKPLQNMNGLDFNKDKRPKKLPKNKMTPIDETSTRMSPLSIRLFLKEFCIEFLRSTYNSIMRVVKDQLVRMRAQENDESYYLWSLKFFMEFNRKHNFQAGLVSETLERSVFHYIQQQIEIYKDNFEHEKRNRRVLILWSRRIHIALRAYSELLFTLVEMKNSKEVQIKQSAEVLLAQVFYEPEYREFCYQMFNLYSSDKMSLSFLQDLVETTHVYLSLMKNLSKSKRIVVGKKVKKRKRKRTEKTGSAAKMSKRETNEEIWEIVGSKITALVQDDDPQLPSVSPFDATLDIDIEEQKLLSLIRIQSCLKKEQANLALALLRASREVWPEGEVFGSSDDDAEEEFMKLREILFADIKKPDNFNEVDDQVEEQSRNQEEVNQEPDVTNLDQENEEFEEYEEEVQTSVVDQGVEFNEILSKFACKNVCQAYGVLLKHYKRNSDFTNHCIMKMFCSIAHDCKMPAMLFQISLFRVFQQIRDDRRILPDNKSINEMYYFSKFILKKFFETAKTNKKVFMEMCFWKTTREAYEIVEGYDGESVKTTQKQKASYWSEELENQVITLFNQFKEMEEKGENVDIVGDIEAMISDSGKSRRQILRKLKQLDLIKDTKGLKKKHKSGKSGRRKRRGDGQSPNASSGEEGVGRKYDEQGNFLSKEIVESDSSSSSSDEEVNLNQKPSNPTKNNLDLFDSSSSDESENDRPVEEAKASVPSKTVTESVQDRLKKLEENSDYSNLSDADESMDVLSPKKLAFSNKKSTLKKGRKDTRARKSLSSESPEKGSSVLGANDSIRSIGSVDVDSSKVDKKQIQSLFRSEDESDESSKSPIQSNASASVSQAADESYLSGNDSRTINTTKTSNNSSSSSDLETPSKTFNSSKINSSFNTSGRNTSRRTSLGSSSDSDFAASTSKQSLSQELTIKSVATMDDSSSDSENDEPIKGPTRAKRKRSKILSDSEDDIQEPSSVSTPRMARKEKIVLTDSSDE